jgi:hypothetical protein
MSLMSLENIYKRRAPFFSISSISLAALLTLEIPVQAQQETEIPAPALKIAVAKGEGSNSNIKKGIAVEPVVVVADEQDRPVSGVMVMFTLPDSGPSGVFANGAKNMIVYSDAEGRAIARGLRPNHIPGKFQITVDASFHGLTARTLVNQTNVMPTSTGVSTKLIAILAIAGGAAAAGVVAASGGGSSGTPPVTTPPPTSTTLSPGTPTFGPPQ